MTASTQLIDRYVPRGIAGRSTAEEHCTGGSNEQYLGNSLLYVRLDVGLGYQGLQTIRLCHSLHLRRLCLAGIVFLKLQQWLSLTPCCCLLNTCRPPCRLIARHMIRVLGGKGGHAR